MAYDAILLEPLPLPAMRVIIGMAVEKGTKPVISANFGAFVELKVQRPTEPNVWLETLSRVFFNCHRQFHQLLGWH
jgi:hypothetical protein